MHSARSGMLVALVLAAAAPALRAQNARCNPYSGRARNLCNAALDATHAYHPIVGLLTSGGNPVLGTSGALGGLGHVQLTARVNATHVVLPDPNYDGTTRTVGRGDALFFPSPIVEAAVGLYGGGPGGFLGLDLLGSAQLVPSNVVDNFFVDPGAPRIGSIALGFGVGARISVLDGRGGRPGVSVSLMRRMIPTVQYGNVSAGDMFSYAADMHAWNVRATVGTQVSALTLAAGLGQDWYSGSALIEFRDPLLPAAPAPIGFTLSSARTMGFADAGLDVAHIKLVGEAGYQLGKDEHLGTTFTDFDPSAGRFFASAGLAVAF
ncbi:MAG TPA: hypothetical protein VFW66_12625 [Gemmatimonadales bacterium]|nr:hypothetical protein [Gemmatimonadales bacterium]